MEAQIAQFLNRGMNQDISVSKASNEFAFRNHNIRITAVNDNTLLSVTNEKGPLKMPISISYKDEIWKSIKGEYLGYSTIENIVVLFTTATDNDYIYLLEFENDIIKGEVKFIGDLNFSTSNPIEALSYYENENIQKVYWVDGINPPRFINIIDSNTLNKDSNQFEFTPKLKGFPTVDIKKEYSDGLFPAGTIQYFISYYNKFGTETGIVWASDIQYISQVDRGESADNNIVCNFNIKIDNIDTSFEYIRVYSLQRTSLNSTPSAKIVADVPITGNSTLIKDTNYKGESIEPTYLLFLGGSRFIASTLSQKDNTIFFGDIEVVDYNIPTDIKDYISNLLINTSGIFDSPFITFETKSFNTNPDSAFQLNQSSIDIKTFKNGEIYRFAIQFQDATGRWTTPIWVGDKKCNIYPSILDGTITVANAIFNINNHPELIELLSRYYVNYRLLIANSSISDRSIIAQGIVSPTVFNHAERVNNNGPYSIASWMIRPRGGNAQYEHLSGLGNVVEIKETDEERVRVYKNTPTSEIQNSIERFPLKVKSSTKDGSTRANRNYSVGYVISVELENSDTVNVSIISTYPSNLVKKTPTSNAVYTDASQIKSENLVSIKQKDSFKITQEGDDPYGYNELSKIIKEFFGESTPLDITKDAYESYIKNAFTYEGYSMLDDTLWSSGLFKKDIQFIKVPNSQESNYLGLYTFKTRYESESSNAEDDVEYSDYTSNYYIDSSIVNFYSPDIEENQSQLSDTEYKFRIIGIAPIVKTISDIILETSTSGIADFSGLEKININNSSNKSLFKEALFKDYGWDNSGRLDKFKWTTYYVYMWNKKGSIIGQTSDNVDSDGEPFTTLWADLKHKIISNHRKSKEVKYFDTNTFYKVFPTVFNTDTIESKILKLNHKNVIYQGNYENLVAIPTDKNNSYTYKVFWQPASQINRGDGGRDGSIGTGNSSSTPSDRIYYYNNIDQVDPVHIKYNTTPHAVFELRDIDGIRKILPYLSDNKETAWDIFNYYPFIQKEETKEYSYPWLESTGIYTQDSIPKITSAINEDSTINLPYVFVGELYKDIDYSTLYGGHDDSALERIQWIPASISTPVNTNITKSSGDTYYQKWDCLTTYPSTEEDMNSVVDITSFMVETHINLDGRYDKNKNIVNTINARRSNYNKINSAYSQSNNFFSYSILNDRFDLNKYKNQVVFSLVKEPSSSIDTWTNVPLTSAFNLNGLYGKLNKIINFNDTLITFQDKAISAINFNNRTALSTESGVSIEIANSGKVNGYTVISSSVGCKNKHSICQTSSGVYFIDDLNKSLFRFNKEGLNNLSATGMSQWFKNNLTEKEYLFYDAITHDVYVVNNSDCLVYNEDLQNFTSFMDYQGMDPLFNIKGNSWALKTEDTLSLYKMFGGKYNTTFDSNEHKGYFVEYKINPEPITDKIFGNVEYIADCFEDANVDTVVFKEGDVVKYPFETLEVWNEYQRGITLIKDRFKYPNFEKKFRIWRVDIPRDESNRRDRIRNPWAYIRLSKPSIDNFKTVFHSLIVKYYK